MTDFLQTLEFAGFTARIKRLSESMMYDAKTLYKASRIDIEPNWHLLFLLLKTKGELSVTEIAQELGFSHPAIIKITQKMAGKGYLESIDHPTDSRKKLLKLTPQSIKQLPEFEKNWSVIESVIQEFVDADFLNKLSQIEDKLAEKKMVERFKERTEK